MGIFENIRSWGREGYVDPLAISPDIDGMLDTWNLVESNRWSNMWTNHAAKRTRKRQDSVFVRDILGAIYVHEFINIRTTFSLIYIPLAYQKF